MKVRHSKGAVLGSWDKDLGGFRVLGFRFLGFGVYPLKVLGPQALMMLSFSRTGR